MAMPNFVIFYVSEQLMLGLWDRACVQPTANWSEQFQLQEIAFMLPNELQLKQQLHDWQATGAILIQEITLMDFGWSFMVQDPDGHRLRVLCPANSNGST